MKVTNTLTKKKENFVPLDDKKVKMYVCGVTPYELSHIGHARTYVSFDVIRRYLEYKGYDVNYTVNVTDVDDKIINKSNELGIPSNEWALKMTKAFLEDMKNLKVKEFTNMPTVSGTMDEIINFVEKLINREYAYELDGDVYFDVSKFSEYGKLSGNELDAISEGSRIEPNPDKRNPADFALWKSAKPGEPFWDSPWSKGRPGWHIECSAMNKKIFGDQIDIHGGGMDLKFPHHENEITQSEALTGKQFSKYWMHTGFLTVNGEKMSKSLGNFTIIRDVLEKISPEALRLFLLRTHYRSPIDFSDNALDDAKESQERLNNTYNRLFVLRESSEDGSDNKKISELVEKAYNDFEDSMDDDFSSSEAFAVVFNFTREVNKILDSGKFNSDNLEKIIKFYDDFNSVFAVLIRREEKIPKEVIEMADERERLRKEKKFSEADSIRDKIVSMGYDIEDTPKGPIVRKG